MGDEIVVMPRPAPRLPDQIVSSRLLVATPPERVAIQLEDWYTRRGRLDPPTFAVVPKIAKLANQWTSGESFFWSYKGLEELSVMHYPLEGFENDRKCFIIVAQGPTKGPFIIKLIQNKKRCLPPVSYHIWEGLDSAKPSDGCNGFERKPSVLRFDRLQKNQYGLTQTVVGGPVQTSEFLPAPGGVFDNNSQTQKLTRPVLSEHISWSKSEPQPQMTSALPNLSPTAEKSSAVNAYETAREAIFTASPIRSPSRNATQQGLPLDLTRDVDISASTMISSPISQTMKSALQIPPHPIITHGLAAEVSHGPTSTLQSCTPRKSPPPSAWKMPSMMPSSLALTKSQFMTKELTPIFSPVEQQTIPPMDHPAVPYPSPQLTFERERPEIQDYQDKELKFCQRVLTRLMDPKLVALNQPFLQPVDPVALSVPEYFKVIKQPMDLSTIQQKLREGDYEDAEGVRKDIRIMFNNCRKFNRKSDPVYECGQLLNKVFVNLWKLWKPSERDDYHVQEVNTHISCNDSQLSVPQEGRPTVEPLTPPTISAASPTQEYAAEESRALSPLRGLVDGPQTSNTDMQNQCTPHQDHPLNTTIPPLRQDSLISSDEQQLSNSSDQTTSNLCGQFLNDLHEHQFTDHELQTRHASPVLSEASWETTRSNREASYISEMLIETEREFAWSEPKDDRGVVRSDDSARDCSSPVRKRNWESIKGNADEAAESASVKRPLAVHPSQTPFEAHSKPTLVESCPESEPLSEDLFVTTPRDQLVPWKEVHEHHDEVSGENLHLHALRMRQARRTDKFSIRRTAGSSEVQPDSGLSLTQPTSSCLAPTIAIQSIIGSSLNPLQEAPEPEHPLSLGPSGTLTERGSSRMQCSYDNAWRKTFKQRTALTRHFKIVHLRRKNKICPFCARRFGRGDVLKQHLRGKACPLKPQWASDEHNVEDQAPYRTEPSTSQSLELRHISPSLPNQRQSATVEAAQDNQGHSRNGVARIERCARSIAEPSPAPNDEQKERFDRSATNIKPLKHETMEDDGFMEMPPPATIRSSPLKQHIRENVMFLFYTPTGKKTRARCFSECDDVHELFGHAIAGKAFGAADQKKKAKGNVLSICFGAGQADREDDLRVKESDKEDFEKLVDAIEQRDWWSERNGAVVGSGILEVRAIG